MDNLEYFNGAVPPSILDDINKNDKNKDTKKEENDALDDKKLVEEAPNIEEKRLPMPPTNTNFKAISAAALVASRRKVFLNVTLLSYLCSIIFYLISIVYHNQINFNFSL